jgi:hypothetical protein
MLKRLLLAMLVVPAFASAQTKPTADPGITFGGEVGFNLTGALIHDPNTSAKGTPGPGFQLGVLADIPFPASPLSLRPKLLFSYESCTPNLYDENYPVHATFLKLPIDVVYHTDGPWFFGVGPYFAMGLGGKYNFQGYTQTVHFGGDSTTDQLHRLDVGLDLMAGYKLRENIVLGASFDFGITNIANASYWGSGNSAHSLCLAVTGAYIFGKP